MELELGKSLDGGWPGLPNSSVDGPADNGDTLGEGRGTLLQGRLQWDSATGWKNLDYGWLIVQLQRLHLQLAPLLW